MCQLQPLMVMNLQNLTQCESGPDVSFDKTGVSGVAAHRGEEFVGEVGVFCQDVGCQVKVLRERNRLDLTVTLMPF